jgi:hypothetical protein
MIRQLCGLVAGSILLLAGASADEPAAGAGWPDVFITLDNFGVRYEKPVVGKGEPPDVYRQTARHHWLGGRFEIIEITLARDPAFKERYSAETLRKEKNPPKELEINKKKAWLWELKTEPGKLGQVARRLVVVLDTDKAITIEQKGGGLQLEDVAKKFDFAKVEQALAKPPKQ